MIARLPTAEEDPPIGRGSVVVELVAGVGDSSVIAPADVVPHRLGEWLGGDGMVVDRGDEGAQPSQQWRCRVRTQQDLASRDLRPVRERDDDSVVAAAEIDDVGALGDRRTSPLGDLGEPSGESSGVAQAVR